ncbi:MAG TPA: hypothetical protein VGU67_08855 [Edaphobacter sp.]|nr:hypothetical protein [Edaphobacter sp.]
MIRQAINCDMCGAEKQEATSHWFVAYEQGGELKLRGWESPKHSRKDVKHLCGQKCAQRLTANFTASVMSAGSAGESAKTAVHESVEQAFAEAGNPDEMPILQLMGYDRATSALIEEESWAGPAKPKASSRTVESKQKAERESFINATRVKPPMSRPFQRMA